MADINYDAVMPWVVFGIMGTLFVAIAWTKRRDYLALSPEARAARKAKSDKEWEDTKRGFTILARLAFLVVGSIAIYNLFGMVGTSIIVGATILAFAIRK